MAVKQGSVTAIQQGRQTRQLPSTSSWKEVPEKADCIGHETCNSPLFSDDHVQGTVVTEPS